MKRRTPPPRKAEALGALATAVHALAAAHKTHAAEVAHVARMVGVLATELAGAAAVLGTELAALRVAQHGQALGPPAPAARRTPVRRIVGRP